MSKLVLLSSIFGEFGCLRIPMPATVSPFRLVCQTVLVLAAILSFSPLRAETPHDVGNNAEEKSPPIVWFVHGMLLARDDFDPELDYLRKIYPDAESVNLIKWNAPKRNPLQIGVTWGESLTVANQFAGELADRILQLPPEKQARLVLVGHSLGARITLRAAAVCDRQNVQIRQVVLAGAAADNDDPDIPAVIRFSKETVYNLINFNDIMLAAYKMAEDHSALGTGALCRQDPAEFFEVVLENSVEHYGYRYLQRFFDGLAHDDLAYEGIIVPQDNAQIDFPTAEGMVWYDILDACRGWRLQQNQVTGHCRILDPDGTRRAWGRRYRMETAFDKVRFQLDQKADETEIPPDEIDVPQDYPNWNRSTLGGHVWWTELDEDSGWKLQKNILSGHCRILDASQVRRACGGEETMRGSFGHVKAQLHNPEK